MMVYDEDAVSEEVILAWFYKFSRSSWNMIWQSRVETKERPFVTWLRQAVTESEEEEESDDE
jgi:hypothetical protein